MSNAEASGWPQVGPLEEVAACRVLRDGEVEVLGRMPWSSNATFLVCLSCDSDQLLAIYKPDGDGKATVEEIPAELAEEAKAAHEALVELVAEGDDALMQEFFDQGTLPIEDLKKGMREAVLAKRIFPVLLSSALV